MARLTKFQKFNRSDVVHRALFLHGVLNEDDVIREFEKVLIEAGRLTVMYWFKEILPEHFERAAHSRYNYANRKPPYIRYKIRKFPSSRGLDLILTGRFKTQVTAAPRSFPSGRRTMTGFTFKIGLSSPAYIPMNRYVDMHAETIAYDEKDKRRITDALRTFVAIGLGYQSV